MNTTKWLEKNKGFVVKRIIVLIFIISVWKDIQKRFITFTTSTIKPSSNIGEMPKSAALLKYFLCLVNFVSVRFPF